MTVEAILTLGRRTDMPRHARDFVEAHLVQLPPEIGDDVVLLVSELVTNVVRHGAEPARLVLTVDERTVHVVVHDCGPAELVNVATSTLPGAQDATGRGLIIVAALASSWGVTYDEPGPGKGVWFTMAVES